VQGCAPFADGVDLFGFYNEIDEKEAQRYADGACRKTLNLNLHPPPSA